MYLTVEKSPSANNHISKRRTVFTNDGVFLEKDVVAFTAANLEDEFTDVEQVASTHSQLQGKCKKNANLIFILYLGPRLPTWPSDSSRHPHTHICTGNSP